MRNTVHNSLPAIIHGNMNTKVNVFFLLMSIINGDSVKKKYKKDLIHNNCHNLHNMREGRINIFLFKLNRIHGRMYDLNAQTI